MYGLFLLTQGCSTPAADVVELETAEDDDLEAQEQEAPALAGYCIAYHHTNKQGLRFTFTYPKDYNDVHRVPGFGDAISSIECFGASLVVWEHVLWAGNSMLINAGGYVPSLHTYGMGDRISSVRWVGEDGYAGSCTAYQHKNYLGAHITFPNRQDFNDLHRMNWGDTISSYQCTLGSTVYFCKHDQWGVCRAFSGSDADIHDDNFGDNISSVTW
jgi:hypothetical protein